MAFLHLTNCENRCVTLLRKSSTQHWIPFQAPPVFGKLVNSLSGKPPMPDSDSCHSSMSSVGAIMRMWGHTKARLHIHARCFSFWNKIDALWGMVQLITRIPFADYGTRLSQCPSWFRLYGGCATLDWPKSWAPMMIDWTKSWTPRRSHPAPRATSCPPSRRCWHSNCCPRPRRHGGWRTRPRPGSRKAEPKSPEAPARFPALASLRAAVANAVTVAVQPTHRPKKQNRRSTYFAVLFD
jgi:hypothetical protein